MLNPNRYDPLPVDVALAQRTAHLREAHHSKTPHTIRLARRGLMAIDAVVILLGVYFLSLGDTTFGAMLLALGPTLVVADQLSMWLLKRAIVSTVLVTGDGLLLVSYGTLVRNITWDTVAGVESVQEEHGQQWRVNLREGEAFTLHSDLHDLERLIATIGAKASGT